jgi:hypothetical protein
MLRVSPHTTWYKHSKVHSGKFMAGAAWREYSFSFELSAHLLETGGHVESLFTEPSSLPAYCCELSTISILTKRYKDSA